MIDDLIRRALENGRHALAEPDALLVVREAGVPTVDFSHVGSPREAVEAARGIGYPVALKATAPDLVHKTERGAVRLDLAGDDAVAAAYDELAAAVPALDGVLVQPMLRGRRELVLGAIRDAQFGPCVMFGVGGIFTEVARDVVFRVAPVDDRDLDGMLDGIRARRLLDSLRGLPGVDRDALRRALAGLGRLLLSHDEILEIDVNPVVVVGGDPVAVDAVVVVGRPSASSAAPGGGPRRAGSGQLARLFEPASLAVVGVGRQGFGFGRGIVQALRQIGYEGRIYPVNPAGGSVAGLDIVGSVADIPEPVDLAIIAVPAAGVPEAVEQCRAAGAAGAVVLSAGFSESGAADGIALEAQLREVAARGIRVIGPNCFGVYRPSNGLTFLPGGELSREPGGVAFISQSGGMAVDLASIGAWSGVRFSTMVSFGNGCDVRETELLDHFGGDPETSIIAMYIEGIADGRTFYEVLRRVAAAKPVLICKGGLTDAGARAAAGHTAAMAGSRRVWQAVIDQCRAVPVDGFDELADVALAFSMLPHRAYRGLSVVGGGGALGVRAVDRAEELGFAVPPLPRDVAADIAKLLPQPGSAAGNPVDAANPFLAPEALDGTLRLAGADPEVDLQVVTLQLFHYRVMSSMLDLPLADVVPARALVDAMLGARQATGKPIVLVLPNLRRGADVLEIEELVRGVRAVCVRDNLPVFDGVEGALRAVAAVARYSRQRQ